MGAWEDDEDGAPDGKGGGGTLDKCHGLVS